MFKKGEIATIITLFGLGVMLVGLTAGSFIVKRNEPLKTFSRATEPTAIPTPFNGANCVDSDGGNNPERPGAVTTTVTSFGSSRVVDFMDTCTQGYDGRKVLREYYCLGEQVKTADQLCVNNCQEGGQGDYCSSSVLPTSLPSNRVSNGTLSIGARNVTSNGGTIDVSLRLPGIASSPTLSRAYYHVSVSGTGVSISPSSQEDLFGSGSAEEKTKSFILTMDQSYRTQNCPTFTVVARAEYYDTDGLLQTVMPVTYNAIPPDNRVGCVAPTATTAPIPPSPTATVAPVVTATVAPGVTVTASPVSTNTPTPTATIRPIATNTPIPACIPNGQSTPNPNDPQTRCCIAQWYTVSNQGSFAFICGPRPVEPSPTVPVLRRSYVFTLSAQSASTGKTYECSQTWSLINGRVENENTQRNGTGTFECLNTSLGSTSTSRSLHIFEPYALTMPVSVQYNICNNTNTCSGGTTQVAGYISSNGGQVNCTWNYIAGTPSCATSVGKPTVIPPPSNTPIPTRTPTLRISVDPTQGTVRVCTADGEQPPNSDARECCSNTYSQACGGPACVTTCGGSLRVPSATATPRPPSPTPTRRAVCPRLSELASLDYVDDNVLNVQDFLNALTALRNKDRRVNALSLSLLLSNLGTNLQTAEAACPGITPVLP